MTITTFPNIANMAKSYVLTAGVFLGIPRTEPRRKEWWIMDRGIMSENGKSAKQGRMRSVTHLPHAENLSRVSNLGDQNE